MAPCHLKKKLYFGGYWRCFENTYIPLYLSRHFYFCHTQEVFSPRDITNQSIRLTNPQGQQTTILRTWWLHIYQEVLLYTLLNLVIPYRILATTHSPELINLTFCSGSFNIIFNFLLSSSFFHLTRCTVQSDCLQNLLCQYKWWMKQINRWRLVQKKRKNNEMNFVGISPGWGGKPENQVYTYVAINGIQYVTSNIE